MTTSALPERNLVTPSFLSSQGRLHHLDLYFFV
jgi:hypothetical protein